jgi:hypothetical protein
MTADVPWSARRATSAWNSRALLAANRSNPVLLARRLDRLEDLARETVHYLGIEVDDALPISEQLEL